MSVILNIVSYVWRQLIAAWPSRTFQMDALEDAFQLVHLDRVYRLHWAPLNKVSHLLGAIVSTAIAK